MKTSKKQFYVCPDANILALNSKGAFLASFGLNPLTEDTSDANNTFVQF